MSDYLQAIVTVLSLVNPVVCGVMFSKIESGRSPREKLMDATKASIAILVILLLAALFRAQVLHQFGISLEAFKVAGVGVLVWMGFAMLSTRSTDPAATDSSRGAQYPSLTPLILFAASPGTITGVITIAVHHSRLEVPLTAIVAVCAAVFVTWPLMVAAARAGGHERRGFVQDTMTRFMGLIIVAMGVQFVLTGVRAFFS